VAQIQEHLEQFVAPDPDALLLTGRSTRVSAHHRGTRQGQALGAIVERTVTPISKAREKEKAKEKEKGKENFSAHSAPDVRGPSVIGS
jgi:hypothetical protein